MKNSITVWVVVITIASIDCCFPVGCRGGQQYNSCGSFRTATCDDPTPTSNIDVCWPRCECPAGQVWHNRECIAPDLCPPRCPKDQVWNECGADCDRTCTDRNPFCSRICVPRCECPPGHFYDALERCVPEEECPVQPPCPADQVYNSCGSACNPTCDNPNPICTQQCVARCECPRGQVFNAHGACVPTEQCPAPCGADLSPLVDGNGEEYFCGLGPTSQACPDNSICTVHPLDAYAVCCPVQCPDGQEFHSCGSACNATCDDPIVPCTLECVPRCECPYGKVFNANGVCVPVDQCPAPCGEDVSPLIDENGDEYFCGLGPTSQFCPDNSTCVGHPLDAYAVCCPVECPYGQEFHSCGSACNATCDDPTPICTEQCVPRCECPRGQLFNARGQCVPPESCPAPCGPDASPLEVGGVEIFCGRGLNRQDCPEDSTCIIHPADRYAVCCPIAP